MKFISPEVLLYAVPLLAAFGVYFYQRARAHAQHSEQLEESLQAGLTEPASLHPVVDPNRCIGSSSCVSACPESAIGVIGGKAQLVNPSACIGHGACAAACPLEAIKLVFGTERRGVDIPQVKPNFETNIPGLFIAGELGGMGLIRKAVEQGRQAIGSMKALARGGQDLDAVIVGAGPAGIAAGLGAIQHKLKYVLLEQEDSLGGAVYHYPRNKIAMTSPVQLPLIGKVKFGEVSKETLLEFWQGVVGKAGLKIRFNERMEAIERAGGGFVVKTTRGAYNARAVLLAVGRRGSPRKLGVPGEELPKVVYRLVDAEQYRGQRVLVVGGGDSALEAALALSEQPGTKAALSYRGAAFDRVKPKNRERLEAAAAAKRIQVLLGSTVERIGAREAVLKVAGKGISVPNDAVIVCAGGVLPIDLLKQVGIEFETKRGTA
ncbi:MAG TPA: NAD(P)-binding domain-containing protein [Burkholderiales bacterium]|jgi:thioredoxin reductase/NAD-dependent dihydropyrimidine dehydrogenase PreA subunit|nr:NAD(P)-binding domain-containing protein [Burkholderiales bacterium]